MLSEIEKRVLEAVANKMLITKEELYRLSENEAADQHLSTDKTKDTEMSRKQIIDKTAIRRQEIEFGIQRLSNMGYIQKVESLGTCFVITQEGARALKE